MVAMNLELSFIMRVANILRKELGLFSILTATATHLGVG